MRTYRSGRVDYVARGLALGGGLMSSSVGGQSITLQDRATRTINVFDFIPRALWPAMDNGTSTVDIGPYIQLAINAAALRGDYTVDLAGVHARLLTQVSLDISRVGIVGGGAVLNCEGKTSGSVWNITRSVEDINAAALFATTHGLRDFSMIGPGVGVTAVTALDINDPRPQPAIANFEVANVGFLNFARDVIINNGAFEITFSKCAFTINNGTPSTSSLYIPAALNSGERIDFVNCAWYNRPNVLVQDNPNTSLFMTSCSLDYQTNVMVINGGSVFLTQMHIEGDADVDNWFKVYGQNTLLTITNAQFTIAQTKTAFAPFYSDASATQGGIVLRNLMIAQPNSWTTYLIDGTGRALVDDLSYFNSSDRPVTSVRLNRLAYGNFESTNFAAEWACTLATRVTSDFHSGTAALRLAPTVGNPASAIATAPIAPGKYAQGELWLKSTGVAGSGGTVFVTFAFVDDAGNTIGSVTNVLTTTTDIAAYTKYKFRITEPAPAGTRKMQISATVFGVTSGTPFVYLDDVIVTPS